MKPRQIALLITCAAVIMTAASCGKDDKSNDTSSDSSSAWYNPYDTAVTMEIEDDYALVVSQAMTENIKKYAQAVDETSMSEIETIEKSLTQYAGGSSEISVYINSLRKLYHCLHGFYTFNSTEQMLDTAIADISTAYTAMTKQNQATFYKPDEKDIRSAAAKISAFAENVK